MTVTTMSQMWKILDAFTLTPTGEERAVNHNNEWGGFSKRLKMPVFTAWFDFSDYNKETKTTTALINDEAWEGRPVGLANQNRWISFAERENNGIAAFFIIHPLEPTTAIRKVKSIDNKRIFVGKIRREGNRVFIDGSPTPL